MQSAAVAAFESSLAAAVPSSAVSASASATPIPASSPITIVHANVSSSLSLVNDADVVVCHSILSFSAKQFMPSKLSRKLFTIFLHQSTNSNNIEQVLHNVFQFFHAPADARKLWEQVFILRALRYFCLNIRRFGSDLFLCCCVSFGDPVPLLLVHRVHEVVGVTRSQVRRHHRCKS